MKLRDLLLPLPIEYIKGTIDIEIENISYNSNNIKPNGLFICIDGFQRDGHDYIKEAIENGAVAILVEKSGIIQPMITVIKVKNTRMAMSKISSVYYNNPSKNLNVIGVTGTNGKTSISYMIKSILVESKIPTGIIGTLATIIEEKKIQACRTTPEALELQEIFSQMNNYGIEYCVMEVSSHSLELNRVDDVDFKIGIFSNLTQDHLDFHKTMDNYREAKKKLFYKTSLCNIINKDDETGRFIIHELKDNDTRLITYGIHENADFMAKNIVFKYNGIEFQVVGPNGFSINSISYTPAIFSVYNGLAAIACCYSLGFSSKSIEEGLKSFHGVPGRFEVIKEIEDLTVVVDYAHTPDALENILKSASKSVSNNLITVFGCGGDRDSQKRPIMGEIAGKYSHLTIITSDNPRTEDPKLILSMIEEGIKKTKGNYIIIEDRKKAIQHAIKTARKGDFVLVAGKGHETTQIIGKEVMEFDDKQVILEAAREEGIIWYQ